MPHRTDCTNWVIGTLEEVATELNNKYSGSNYLEDDRLVAYAKSEIDGHEYYCVEFELLKAEAYILINNIESLGIRVISEHAPNDTALYYLILLTKPIKEYGK